MNTHPPPKLPLLFLAIGVVAAVAGFWFSQQTARQAVALTQNMTTITLLPGDRALPQLALIDENNQPVTRETFTGQWSLVFRGFTNCGHIFPMTLAEIRMIRDKLAKPLNVIFVSVDPNRDTPEIIKDYVHTFDASFKGMTGTPD